MQPEIRAVSGNLGYNECTNRVAPAWLHPPEARHRKGELSMHPKDTPTPKPTAITLNGHGIRERISPAVRNEVMLRDNLSCVYCGAVATSLDHVIPSTYGGKSTVDNLVAACSWCNNALNSRFFEDGIDGKQAYIRERLGRKYRHVKRTLSICADCGEFFEHARKSATSLLCAKCVRIDKDIFAIRDRLDRDESLVTIADEYGVVPEVLSDRVYKTDYRRARERAMSAEDIQEFLRGIREPDAEYTI